MAKEEEKIIFLNRGYIELDGVLYSKWLKEESCTDVLDKIRAEIEQMTPTYHNNDWFINDLVPISRVLKIIDKYKKESEE